MTNALITIAIVAAPLIMLWIGMELGYRDGWRKGFDEGCKAKRYEIT